MITFTLGYTVTHGFSEPSVYLITRQPNAEAVQQSLTRQLDTATWTVLAIVLASLVTLIAFAYRLYGSLAPCKVRANVDLREIAIRLTAAIAEPDALPWFKTFSTGSVGQCTYITSLWLYIHRLD